MSNFILSQVAQTYAKEKIKEFITEYNSEQGQQLTQKGKRELFEMKIFYAFLAGFNFGDIKKSIEDEKSDPEGGILKSFEQFCREDLDVKDENLIKFAAEKWI